jgi:hypothetical protein
MMLPSAPTRPHLPAGRSRRPAKSSPSQTALLVAESGLRSDPELLKAAGEYVRRTHRGRRYGLVGGFLLGVVLPATADQGLLAAPLIPAGYILGVLISDSLAPRRDRSAVRQAALRPRRSRDLVPTWARLLYWALLGPLMLTPLLALVHAPPGATSTNSPAFNCWLDRPVWPSVSDFVLGGALAGAGLVLTEVTLAGLARRARPADNAGLTVLDDVTRRLSARSVAAGAIALGLTLIAAVCGTISYASQTSVCTAQSVSGSQPSAFPWAAAMLPLITVAYDLCLVGTLLIVCTSGRRSSPRRVLAGLR